MTILSSTGTITVLVSSNLNMHFFLRNLKGFMIQGGDPTGTGKGGQSIWGKPFVDEVRSTLKVSSKVYYSDCYTHVDTSSIRVV